MSSKVEEWTVLSMLEWATDFFKQKDIPDPRHSIEWLLAEVLDIKRLDLYLKFDRPLSKDELDELRPLVKRRAQHEPLQYIIGFSEFMNARITVNEHVLIPRIETEQLVEIILDQNSDDKIDSVLDIGTGSGCIPIALKMERPEWNVTGIDISKKALEVAQKNAKQNDVNVQFTEGDILQPEQISFDNPLDIIVSNPPYVLPDEKEILQPQVREFEPELALFCDDMDKLYGNIIKFSDNHLSEEGKLYLEIHEQHAQQILSLFNENRWNATVHNDYDKKPRFVIAKRR